MTENNPWSSSASPRISRSPSVSSICSSLPEYSVASDSPPDYRTRQAIARATAELEALGHSDAAPVPSGAPGGGPNIRRAGIEAAQALRDIKTMLESLTIELAGLGVDAKGYLSTLEMIKQGFRTVERASRELAIRIAQYGEKFDLVVIQFCADPKLSVERRVRKIEQFIHDAEEFQTKAYAIQDEFMELQKRFGRFVSTFSDWAKEREEANPVTIKRLCAEVEKLNARLKSQPWRAVTATAALCAAVFLGFTLANPCGIGLAALPTFKNLALAVGISLAGFGWNAVETRKLTNAILTKQAEIKKLESEMEHIKATRTELQKAAIQNYTAFTNNLNLVSEMWQQVANDAAEILQWLRDGANDADEPLYMKYSLDQGVARYEEMARYLRDYANGVNL